MSDIFIARSNCRATQHPGSFLPVGADKHNEGLERRRNMATARSIKVQSGVAGAPVGEHLAVDEQSLRLALDSDTIARIEAKNHLVAKELAGWNELALSTDFKD